MDREDQYAVGIRTLSERLEDPGFQCRRVCPSNRQLLSATDVLDRELRRGNLLTQLDQAHQIPQLRPRQPDPRSPSHGLDRSG